MMKKVLATIILKKFISHPSSCVFTVRQWSHVLVATELNLALNLSYYLYKNATLALVAKKKLESLLIFPV